MEMLPELIVPLILVAGIVGLFVGSFINVVVDRSFAGEEFVRGRSHCDHCGRTLSPFELVPVLSWLVQGGKSRCCGRRLSVQYPLVELMTGVSTAILMRVGILTIPMDGDPAVFVILTLVRAALLWNALVILVSDAKHQLIPVHNLAAGVLLSLLHAVLVPVVFRMPLWPGLSVSLLSGSGAAFMFFILWAGSRGRAMGDGDIYLAFMVGVLSGYPGTVFALYGAFLTGAVVGAILIIGRKKRLKSHVAFGPFLLLGLGIALVFSDGLLTWWRTLWGM